MTPRQLSVEIETAYDLRDREKLKRALLMLVALAENSIKARYALLAAPKEPESLDPSE